MTINAEMQRLGDLIADISAGVSLTGESRPPVNGEIGILTLAALSGPYLNPEACKAIGSDAAPRLGPYVKAGSILMSRSNTPELVGSCVYVDADRADRYLPDLIWEIRLRDEIACDARWLAEYFRSSPGRRNLLRAAAGTSESMIKLSMDRLRNLKITVPPLAIQRVTILTGGLLDQAADGIRSLERAKRRLKRGLMQQLPLTRRQTFFGCHTLLFEEK